MIWHLLAEEKPEPYKRIIVRDKYNCNCGHYNDEILIYDGKCFVSPLWVSHFRVDINNIIYWGYYKDTYKY